MRLAFRTASSEASLGVRTTGHPSLAPQDPHLLLYVDHTDVATPAPTALALPELQDPADLVQVTWTKAQRSSKASKASSLVKEARSSLRLDLYTGLGKLQSRVPVWKHLGERKLSTDSPTGRSRSTGLSRVSGKNYHLIVALILLLVDPLDDVIVAKVRP